MTTITTDKNLLEQAKAALIDLMGGGTTYIDRNGLISTEFDYAEARKAVADIDAALLAPATAPEQDAHPDDKAVDRFAGRMKWKLAKARARGKSGWQDRSWTPEQISAALRQHVDKGDPTDVANYCMFLSARGEPITPATAPEHLDPADLCDVCKEPVRYGSRHHACGEAMLRAKANAAPATAPEKTVKEIMEFARHYAADTFSSATLEDKIRRSLAVSATAPEQRMKELEAENNNLRTVMMAAAVEIQEHWNAHCDEDGYGPANLVRRLEHGYPEQYGYNAETVVRLVAENEQLRKDAERYRWLAEYLVSDDEFYDDAIVAATTVKEVDSVIDNAMKGTP